MVSILVFSFLLFNGCQIFQKPEVTKDKYYSLTTRTRVNVRLGPSVKYHKLSTIPAGRELKVIGKSPDEHNRNRTPAWYGQWYRVQLANGEIGFIASNGVRRANTTYAIARESKMKHVYESPGSIFNTKKIRPLKTGEKVTILQHKPAKNHKDRKEKGIHSRDMSKVKFEDGQTGWVYTSFLDWAGLQAIPNVNTPTLTFSKKIFGEKYYGTSEKVFQEEFGPPYARNRTSTGINTYYYNIKLIDERFKHDHTIVSFRGDSLFAIIPYGKKERSYRDYLPASGLIRQIPLSENLGHFSNWLKTLDNSEEFHQKFFLTRWLDSLSWWLRIIVGLLLVVPTFLLMLFVMEIPFFLGLWGTKRMSKSPAVSNNMLLLILLIVLLISYVWWILLIQNVYPFNHWFVIWFFGALFFALIRLNKLLTRLVYSRCPNCNHLTAMLVKTTLTDHEESKQRITTMKFKEGYGRYVPTDSKIETTTKNKYREAMKCRRCGHEWYYNDKTKSITEVPDNSRITY
jgi:hypothetical protein